MKTRFKILLSIAILTIELPAMTLVGGAFGKGEESGITDLAAFEDDSILACGVLDEGAALPAAKLTTKLLEGNHADGKRGFVAHLSPDLSEILWISVFPAECIAPTRVAIAPDGSFAVGGTHLGGFADLDKSGANWNKGKDCLAKLPADGSSVLWFTPGGPEHGDLTGLAIDEQGRVYFTADSKTRGAANHLIRRDGDTGEIEKWADDAWCVYLHTNQEALKADGEFIAYYDKSKEESEDGFGYDYDGEGGWGPVEFHLKGFRHGGQVLVLPGGDLLVSSCLQYDFRENPRKDGKVTKGKKFPAFDYFLARYSNTGELRWSTNLYQKGDSIHTPDQKPIDLAYDPKTDSVYCLVKQHGSNVYRFKGELLGDTGNLTIGWLGKVEAKTGELQEGWYFQNNRTGKFQDNGLPASPPHPKLAGNALTRVAIGSDESVYLTGIGSAQTWTTDNALQPWPEGQSGGGEGVLLQLSPDLDKVGYATCLFTDAEPRFTPSGLAVTKAGIIIGGSGSFSGDLAGKSTKLPWSSETDSGCMIFGILK